MRNSIFLGLCLWVSATLACGCIPSMAVPQTLVGNSDIYLVERSIFTTGTVSGTFTFGPYTASDVDWGVMPDLSADMEGQTGTSQRRIAFKLSDGSPLALTTECWITETTRVISGEGSSWKVSSVEHRSMTCHMAGLQEPISLSLSDDTPYGTGGINWGTEHFSLRPTSEKSGGGVSLMVLGYLFEQDGATLGANSLLREETVYLSRSVAAEKRLILAAASVALIIF
ncbi:MAG: hypothetical protein MUC50_20695 [Myxococcota bacterium]|nr:hypothetical protein [Myxococcota bacterium]